MRPRVFGPFVLAASLAGVVLILLTRGGPGDLDSPEIAAALGDLGQIHPPGHPAWLGISMPFLLLPVGPQPFRLAVGSAVLLAMAAGVLAEIAWTWLRPAFAAGPDEATDSGVDRALAALFGALAVLVPGVAEHGIRPEVYALHLLLVSIALHLLLRLAREADRPRDVLGLGVVEGLALANHHYLTVFALLLPTLLVLWRPAGPRLSRTLRCAAGVGIGALAYLALLARDPAASELVWLDTRSPQGLLDMILARPFQGSLGADPRVDLLSGVAIAGGMLVRFTGPLPFSLGLLGAGALLLRRPRGAAVFGLAMAGGLLSKAGMFADPTNPDDRGYLIVGLSLWTLLGAGAAYATRAWLAGRVPGARWRRGAGLALLGIVGAVGADRVAASAEMARGQEAPSLALLRGLSGPLPAGGLALVHYYQSVFLLRYGQAVEGRRPDVLPIEQSMGAKVRSGEDVLRIFARRHPELRGLVAAYRREGGLPLAHLDTLVRRGRPVAIEPAPSLVGLPLERMELRGLLAELHDAPREPTCDPSAVEALFGPLARAPRSKGMRETVIFHLLEQTLFQIRRGHVPCSRAALKLLEVAAGRGATSIELWRVIEDLATRADPRGIAHPNPYRRLPFPLP